MFAPSQYEEQQPPPEEAPPGFSIGRVVLWLIVFSLAALFVPLYLVFINIQTASAALRVERASLQAELERLAVPSSDTSAQLDTLTGLQEQNGILQPVIQQLNASYVNMPDLIAALSAYDPAVLSLTSIQQVDTTFVLSGQAPDQRIVIQYTDLLRQSNQFEQVVVEGITLAALPTPTALPGSAGTDLTPVVPVTTVEFTLVVTFAPGWDS